MRFAVGLLALALSLNGATAQLKLEGPSTIPAGGMKQVQIVLDEKLDIKKADLKVAGLVNGKQSKDNWNVFKDLDDKPVIVLTPVKDGDEGKRFTFVVSINKDGKTYQQVHEVLIEGKKPDAPPDVDPNKPLPTGLAAKFQAAYDKAPNPAALKAYKDSWDAVVAQKFARYADFEVALVATTKRFIPNDIELRSLRDTVATETLLKIGDDPRQVDQTKLTNALNEVVAALKSVK